LLGLEFADKAKPVHEDCSKENNHRDFKRSQGLRLLPPLCLQKDQVDLFVDALGKVFAQSWWGG
jgi:acetylornithine/succinyldiaminopimelate/putrescine aminotransferase